jgi:hypothetical protein
MRNLIIGAAALFAVIAPGIASADTGGSLRLTYASIDDADNNNKDNVVALSGVVITDLPADSWRLQFNGSSADVDLNNTSYAYSQAEVHATYNAGQFQVGAFTGVSNTNGYSWYEYGVEAAVNFSRGQIAVSAAGATSPNTSYDDVSTVAATGTFMLTDNVSIGANVSTTDFGNYGSGDSVDSWGANIAYQIPNSHFAVALGYRSSSIGHDDVDFVGVSLTWGFGEGARGREMPGAMALIPDAIADE